MQVAPKYPELLQLRGQYFLCGGDAEMAVRHFTTCRSVASGSNNCTMLLRTTTAFFENQKKAHFKIKIKEYNEADAFVKECERAAHKVCPQDSKLMGMASALEVKVLIAQGRSGEALEKLNGLLKSSPNSTELLLERAALLQQGEAYNEAMKDYQTVRKLDPENKRGEEGVEKIAQIQEKAKNVDFYEVLELSKGCSDEEIKLAYKAQARKWHPDRFSDPMKKKQAEKMMTNLNRAFDVLGNRTKRALYDQGIDPESGMGQENGQYYQQGNPFEQFGFGGFGGFRFGRRG
jgi:tetratricopeptide (TPR) repeat protein